MADSRGSWTFLALQNTKEPRVVRSPEVLVDEQNDGRDDTASSLDYSPQKKGTQGAHDDKGVVIAKSISAEDEKELLPYMPAIFGTDLPPCNAEIQVAYENVNLRLRELWLHHRGRVSVIEICRTVKETLDRQNTLFPSDFTLKSLDKRPTPWRRHRVFKYERRWVDYFLREAETYQPELMSESEIMEKKKESSVPLELAFNLSRGEVLKSWDEWHEKKRVRRQALPDQVPSASQKSAEHGDGADPDADLENVDLRKETKTETHKPVDPPTTDGTDGEIEV